MMKGYAKLPGGECHVMHLRSPFLTPQKVDEHVHCGIHILSKGLSSAYKYMHMDSCQKEHDVIGVSCDDVLVLSGCFG